MRTNTLLMAMGAGAIACAPALGGYSMTQGTSAPTYSSTLNFDEVGGPTGVGLASDSWTSYGIADLTSGDSIQVVADATTTPGYGWLGTGNSFTGNFGVFITFADDVDAMSIQVWDPSGPPSFFGGGLGIFVFSDGVDVSDFFDIEPAWGGIGDEWFNIVADGGMTFDEVRILGYGFTPTTYVDNLSWNTVPAPSSFALLGLGAVVSRRRRA